MIRPLVLEYGQIFTLRVAGVTVGTKLQFCPKAKNRKGGTFPAPHNYAADVGVIPRNFRGCKISSVKKITMTN